MIALYRQGRGRYNQQQSQPTTVTNRCKLPWHTQYNYNHPTSRTRFILHRSVHLFHYTFCSTGPMEADRSSLNMPLMNGARSMLIDSRLTTSCNEDEDEDGSIQTYSIANPILSHQDNVLLDCRYTNLEKKEARLPIHCYLNTHTY